MGWPEKSGLTRALLPSFEGSSTNAEASRTSTRPGARRRQGRPGPPPASPRGRALPMKALDTPILLALLQGSSRSGTSSDG